MEHEDDAEWRRNRHARLGRGPAEAEGAFYARLEASVEQLASADISVSTWRLWVCELFNLSVLMSDQELRSRAADRFHGSTPLTAERVDGDTLPMRTSIAFDALRAMLQASSANSGVMILSTEKRRDMVRAAFDFADLILEEPAR